MKTPLCLIFSLMLLTFCAPVETDPFSGDAEPGFDRLQIFDNERFPNIVTAMDGTVIATWGGISHHHGTESLLVRRSEDGGESWSDPIVVAEEIQWSGGGVTVDESSGDILVFVESPPVTTERPAGTLTIYRSRDHGLTWFEEPVTLHPDRNGNIPSMHMNESGITLRHPPHEGRLLRPSRSYGQGNEQEYWPQHYTNAIYSDDGGKTWYTSDPFPAFGTGEAAIAELSDGRIYYNSRRHLSTDGLNPRMRHIAWSRDGGVSWDDLSVSDVLPDGSQHRDYGLMAGLIRLPVEDHDILIYSNIESNDGRHGGTVWASFDGGLTWPVKRLVDEGGFAYSSLTVGRNGTPSEGWIYLLYEDAGHPHSRGIVARFNMAWLTGGADWRTYLD